MQEAPSCVVDRCNYSRRESRRQENANFSGHDKNEGTYRSGEGVKGPPMLPSSWVAIGKEGESKTKIMHDITKMSFDKIFDLTAGVHLNFHNM